MQNGGGIDYSIEGKQISDTEKVMVAHFLLTKYMEQLQIIPEE